MWAEPWTSRYMTMLPMYPKLGKMLILGAAFNCLDLVLTIVTGLSVRDPFLTPMDKKDHNEKSSSAGLIGNDNTASVLKSHIPYSRISGRTYDYKSDSWSLGMVILECAIGRFPYIQSEEQQAWPSFYELLEAIVGSPPPSAPPDQFSPEFCSFVSAWHLLLVRL